MPTHEPVLSRHRLPHPYRIGLTVLWVTPASLFFLTLLAHQGFTASLLDPRFWLPALAMCLPALYVWREGVDVLPSGIVARVHMPRYYPYADLGTWYLDRHPDRRVLTVWDTCSRKVLECRSGHLTDLPTLLAALKANVRYRNWQV